MRARTPAATSSASRSRSSRERTRARRSSRAPSTTKNNGTKNPSPRPISCSATRRGGPSAATITPAANPAMSTLVSNRSAIHASVNSTSSETRRSSANPCSLRRVAQSFRPHRRRARATRPPPIAAAPAITSRLPEQRAGDAAGREHERNREHRDDVERRDPRQQHQAVACRGGSRRSAARSRPSSSRRAPR